MVAVRYVDEASLSEGMRWVVRLALLAVGLLVLAIGLIRRRRTLPTG